MSKTTTSLFQDEERAHLFATTSLGIFLPTIGRSMPQFALLLVGAVLFSLSLARFRRTIAAMA